MKMMEGSASFIPEEAEEGSSGAEAISMEMQEAMMRYMPLRGAVGFGNATMTDVQDLVDKLNAL